MSQCAVWQEFSPQHKTHSRKYFSMQKMQLFLFIFTPYSVQENITCQTSALNCVTIVAHI